MGSSIAGHPSSPPRAVAAGLTAEHIAVTLRDGRELSVPISWFGWLARSSDRDRTEITLIEDGAGIWWPRLDEGLSVAGLLGTSEHD
jgi:hypothetical protein